jgi:hypothetical protein
MTVDAREERGLNRRLGIGVGMAIGIALSGGWDGEDG